MNSSAVVIRSARESDLPALLDLAELDSAPALVGCSLVAEVDGRIVAARAESGARIADPFLPTAELLALLELRARPCAAERVRGARRLLRSTPAARARAA